jgi:hypothetical protein
LHPNKHSILSLYHSSLSSALCDILAAQTGFPMMAAQSCPVQRSYPEASNYPAGHTQFRYFNLSGSTSSVESSSASSSSEYTTTSSSTNPGVGSITGKGILAFGKMAQRGLDGIIIRRRLTAMKSVFPHDDGDETLDKIYDDVLELSRYVRPPLRETFFMRLCFSPFLVFRHGLYGLHFRKKALKIILIQMASGNTRYLIRSIAKWPAYETLLFVTELMACMPSPWLQLTG